MDAAPGGLLEATIGAGNLPPAGPGDYLGHGALAN